MFELAVQAAAIRKHLAAATLIGCCAPWASATIDCRKAVERPSLPGELAALVYADASKFGANGEAEVDKLRRYLDTTVLGNYKTKLGYTSPRAKLRFIVCGGGVQLLTLRERRDVGDLRDLGVVLALWRSTEGDQALVSHVLPAELERDMPSELADAHIVFLDWSTANDLPGRWNDPASADAPALQSLIGLSLGMALLERGDGAGAKLALCKGRGDMRTAVDRRLRPAPTEMRLAALFQTLIAEADKLIDAGSKVSADLSPRISAACAS